MAGLKSKIHIKELLQKILNGKVVPVVTDCIFKEIELLNNTRGHEADFSGAKLIAKAYFRHKCGHIFSTEKGEAKGENRIVFDDDSGLIEEQENDIVNNTDICSSSRRNSMNATDVNVETENKSSFSKSELNKDSKRDKTFDSFRCILDVVSKNENSKKFIVASQDHLLRKKLSKVPGVPSLYLFKQVPVLEQPSYASNVHNSAKEESRMAPQEWEYSIIPSLKESLEKNEQT
ncbi:hypothetical protein FG386_000169 [Cryptosporidium ryanae]|uniref:uncharacterized protein n=1 Tax=Cryptosporidium ryanae TaxID=515981 RepID=UPI00351A0835|nr:hypothetical protein FG386_000169 [Cryptosporidium ryanae]